MLMEREGIWFLFFVFRVIIFGVGFGLVWWEEVCLRFGFYFIVFGENLVFIFVFFWISVEKV